MVRRNMCGKAKFPSKVKSGNLRGPKNLSGLPSLLRAICEHTVGTSLVQHSRQHCKYIIDWRQAANVGSFSFAKHTIFINFI